jgi:hypothetical protein
MREERCAMGVRARVARLRKGAPRQQGRQPAEAPLRRFPRELPLRE